MVAEVKLVFNQLMSGNIQPVEYYENALLNKNGETRIVAFHNTVLRDKEGKPSGILSSGEDMTDRKRIADALQTKTEELERYFSSSLDLLCIADTDGNFRRLNPEWEQTLGYSLANLEGKRFLDLVHPDDMAATLAAVAKLEAQDKVFNFENRYRCKDGSYRWIEWRSVPIGKLIYAAARDITARKRAEEEKQILEERLTRSEKMESLGLLAGGVAHDLNNVLGIVVGYSEMVLDAIDEKSPLRKDLTTIFDGGQRAAAIVDDLLTLARRGVVGKKVLNLNKLIADFKKSPQWSKLLTYHPSVKIQIEMEQDLLNIAASSIHLEKTLYNLVSNASEAMTKGGSISIKTNNRYIDKPISGYDTILEGDYVVLSVSDEGDGISETDLKRIFEPFYTKKIMGRSGTGLGLSVVWGTVKDHQGYIDVQSEEGKGTTFSLYFLITREDIEEESLAVSMSEYLGNGQTLLIVDDVKDQRDLAARLLTSLNYKVSSVPSGEDAIKYLKDHQTDLIVLDMIMDPGMDGLDTYKSVLEINPKQKAIIVSGFSESDRAKEAKILGAGSYVRKPYIKERLGLAVKKELARK
jgi:PAS domain S-box-containing protein